MMDPHPPPSPRTQNAAVVVPLVGLLLLMPPFISLFAAPVLVFGIPLVVLYMFGVWIALVLLTWWLGRRLAPDGDSSPRP
jgi:hypothetical protein